MGERIKNVPRDVHATFIGPDSSTCARQMKLLN
jgi:hypothetical protein